MCQHLKENLKGYDDVEKAYREALHTGRDDLIKEALLKKK